MKHVAKLGLSVLAGLSFSGAVNAMVNQAGLDTYHRIPERNLFNLKAPVEPTPPPAATPPERHIRLTGITTIFGDKRALFMVQDPSQAGKPAAKEESFILAEGQRQGALEVLQVDEKSGKVRIKNNGKEMVVVFDPVKLPGAPANAAAPNPAASGLPMRRPTPAAPPPPALPENGSSPAPPTGMRWSQGQDTSISEDEKMTMLEALREANGVNQEFPPVLQRH